MHEQLRCKGATLHLLWQQYRQAHPDGFHYSRFCEVYRKWADTLEPVMQLPDEPGQKLFVDLSSLIRTCSIAKTPSGLLRRKPTPVHDHD
jgi:transposase